MKCPPVGNVNFSVKNGVVDCVLSIFSLMYKCSWELMNPFKQLPRQVGQILVIFVPVLYCPMYVQ